MLYNRFYLEDSEWIKFHCEKGIQSLKYNTNLYSGLMVDRPDNLKNNILKSLAGGAKGISIFSLRGLKNDHVNMLSRVLKMTSNKY